MKIPDSLISEILTLAAKEYPSECCGFLLGPKKDSQTASKFIACRNIQDELHRQNPAEYPRDSRTAYWMDPKDLIQVQKKS